ncbi:LacI family transcriptional regulator [Mesorhizobium sp. B2-5-13]|uniref:LacI family DNA-binding transcriptional regulator n=1 Tax=unclassified Mesorhizobium TaxID=325217 RepID=UPI00112A8F79|nr:MULTISPECIES: LacI family DNA-binding transcriptional regulator [unclassified Mesorhizobium]TPJ81921.1 LacI family transcriptional regulator [Mesorhizobium sp. B2-5-13]TPK45858.1 LacI family transcriptional regulator [Mesorhizobium sp. B2-5-5]
MPTESKDDTTEKVAGGRQLRMADIARIAGVDISTVSRALSGSPRVTEETRARIAEIVRDTGYVVNKTAVTLRDGRTNQVLVIIPDISASFYPEVVQGIVEVLAKRGINVLLGATMYQAKREAELGKQLLTGVVDGIITITGSVPETIANMVDLDRKVVALARPVAHQGVPWVTIDNYGATKEVMEYLHGMGHRRIVHIAGPSRSETFRDRSAAYVDFMRDNGLAALTDVRETELFNADAGVEMMKAVLCDSQRPTAVFCGSDELAIGAMAAARHAKLSIPDDISFFGFDDLKLAGLLYPPLSTVSVPRFEMGRKGAEVIFNRIYKGTLESQKIVLRHRLAIRDSVARIG